MVAQAHSLAPADLSSDQLHCNMGHVNLSIHVAYNLYKLLVHSQIVTLSGSSCNLFSAFVTDGIFPLIDVSRSCRRRDLTKEDYK